MTHRRAAWVPPMRGGVGASRVGVGASHACLLDFLVARFPVVDDWPARLARGDVLDEAGRPVSADAPCRPGTMLWYWRDPPPEPRVPFEIELLHRDDHLVVVDKPHFLAVAPAGRHLRETVLVRLKALLGIETLVPMHRLDRDTAGVLAFTVQPATRHAYQSLLRDRQVHKVYEAVAPWRDDLPWPMTCRSRLVRQPGDAFMQMRCVDGEPNAETLVEPIAMLPGGTAPGSRRDGLPDGRQQDGFAPGRREVGLAVYRLTPLTGRTHQLRVQMSALGLPIVNDRIYPTLMPDVAPDYARPLQLLARELRFTDPISGAPRRFVSARRLLWAP